MNDSRNSYPSPKTSSPKPQWMKQDEDQPVVGRVVSVGGSVASSVTSEGQTPQQVATAPQAADTQATEDTTKTAGNEPLGRIGRSKLAILTTVFVVAGVLGVPLIVYSPVFSKIEKVFWSTMATLYSGVLLYILYRVIVWFLAQI